MPSPEMLVPISFRSATLAGLLLQCDVISLSRFDGRGLLMGAAL
jgi:hypothetical protein